MRNLFSHAVRAGLLCLGTAVGAAAQCSNLVPNGFFDSQAGTPTGAESNVRTDYPYANGGDEAVNWRATNYSSPDYYATNVTNPGGGNQNGNTRHGSVTPYPGPSVNGCIGIYGFSNGVYGQQRYKEYITNTSRIWLNAGVEYYATMQAYRSTDSSPSQYTRLGMVLSTDNPINNTNSSNPNSSGVSPALYGEPSNSGSTPYILSTNLLTTTGQWTTIDGLISPSQGGAYYLNIGNFLKSGDTELSDSPGSNPLAIYYFLDAVGIYQVPTAGPAVAMCPGGSAVLGSSSCAIPGASYSWALESGPGPLPYVYGGYGPQLTVRPSATSTYRLTVTLPNQVTRTSTATVYVQAANLTLQAQAVDNCARTAPFHINFYNSAYQYALSDLTGGLSLPSQYNPNALPADFTLQGTGSSTGGSFKVTLTGCGTTSATGSVSFTTPSPHGYYSCGYGPSYGSGVTLQTVQTLDITNPEGGDVGMFLTDTPYNYTISSSNSAVVLTNTQGTSTHFILEPGQGTTIRVTSTNAPCSEVGQFVFNTSSRRPQAQATPNPAATELTVIAGEPDEPADAPARAASSYTIELYDRFGRKVKTQRSATSQTVLDVRNIPSGLYYLRSGTGKTATSTPIQITH